MPDGSDSPQFLNRLNAAVKIISPPAPPAEKDRPLTRDQAEAYHRQARVTAAGVVTLAELSGAVALGLLANPFVGLALGAGYLWLARRNSAIQHPTLGNYWEAKEHVLYDDMVRNYGSSIEKLQTTDKFKPYNAKRGKWSYRLGGLWCGATSRSLGSCIIREIGKEIARIPSRMPKRRDPIRRQRWTDDNKPKK